MSTKRPPGRPRGRVAGEVAAYFAALRSEARPRNRALPVIRRTIFTACASASLKVAAKSMADIYARCRPGIERRMGVPLSKGMASEIVLLATSGGFPSGRTLGLAVFWGGFPDREDSMIEFITHEAVHSWVLPFAEVWNEPIATYVGNLVMIDMGHEAEAQRRIRQTIARATRLDSTMTLYALEGKGRGGARELRGGEANDIHWGKTFWIFEQLRQEHPDIVARYFQAKRRLATPDKIQKYDVHATVAVLSVALGRDLFPWFNEHGIEADPGKSPIPPVAEAPALRPRGHVFFQADFEGTNALHGWAGAGKLESGYRSQLGLTVELKPDAGSQTDVLSADLPAEAMRGYLVRGSAMVRAETVSAKPNPWNGIKCMLAIETPERKLWPQATIETGTFDWRRVTFTARITERAYSPMKCAVMRRVCGCRRCSHR